MRSLVAISFALMFCSPGAAHHGPLGVNEDGTPHYLHLGSLKALDKKGVLTTFAITASDLKEFRLGKPNFANCGFGCGDYIGREVVIQTDNILSYGPYSFDVKNANAGAAVTVGLSVINPLLALPFVFAEGQTNISYQVTYANSNGDVVTYPLGLSSVRDMEIFNQYLQQATGRLPGQAASPQKFAEINSRKLVILEEAVKVSSLPLMAVVKGKPWCKQLTLTGNKESKKYENSLKALNDHRLSMGLDVESPVYGVPDEKVYEDYMSKAPHMKVWAEANPSAAEKFKSCPSA